MIRLAGLLLAAALLTSGCCAPAYKQPINCQDTIWCDFQRFLAIDEFTIGYMRNSAACLESVSVNKGQSCETCGDAQE